MARIPWMEKPPPIATDMGEMPHLTRGSLLIRRPYGCGGYPMRCVVSLSDRIRSQWANYLKTDVCAFNNLVSRGELVGFLISHVGDPLFLGTAQFRKEAHDSPHTARTGGAVENPTAEKPIIRTALLPELSESGRIHLYQKHYLGEVQMVDAPSYVGSNCATLPKLLKTTPKLRLGPLIRVHQTRPDIGFAITQIATQIGEACESPTKSKTLGNLYKK